jgi:hypothetical protein
MMPKKAKKKKYKLGRPLFTNLTLTAEEDEYLELKTDDLGLAKTQYLRDLVYRRGWRQELEVLRLKKRGKSNGSVHVRE